MFGLLTRSRRRVPSPRPRSFRPTLEALEARNCPSTISLTTSTSPSTMQVTVSGTVTNTSTPGGLTVLLSGVIGGTATTDSGGNFSGTFAASGQGTAYAATSDGQSNIATSNVADPGTTITIFGGSEGPSDVWVFSGKVAGGYQGETVNFDGIQSLIGKSTTTDANGNFTYAIQLDEQPNDNGFAYAEAVDAWGVSSSQRDFIVEQTLCSNTNAPLP